MKQLLIIALGIVSLTADAQSDSYAAYIRLGMMNLQKSGEVLPKVVPGVTGFSNWYYGVGGEFEYKIDRLVLTGDISVMAHGPVNNGTAFAEPFAGTLTGKTGIVVFERKNILLYPAIGAGVNGLFMNTYTKADGIKSNLHTVYLLTPAVDFGLNGDVVVYQFRNEYPTGVLPVGVRAGYRFTTESDKWKRSTGTAVNRQRFNTSGWYFTVALGIGYHSSGKKTGK